MRRARGRRGLRLGRRGRHHRGLPLSAALLLPLALVLAAEPAPGEPPPAAPAPVWRVAAEGVATVGLTELYGIRQTAVGFRVGVGAQGQVVELWGRPTELSWLITLAGTRASSDHGVDVREARLGLEARARRGRLTGGLAADVLYLWVDRVSTGGTPGVAGFGARLLVGLDVVRFGQGALFLDGEASLALLGLESRVGRPALQAALGVRW